MNDRASTYAYLNADFCDSSKIIFGFMATKKQDIRMRLYRPARWTNLIEKALVARTTPDNRE